jgi:glycosyltransferase involved in cell wall biosynthesis
MTGTPEVSVVMPVYNAAAYLEDALDSMLRQTFEAFELIAIDDGCTDGSREILERYRRQDARITVLEQDHRGIVAALNAGFARARGAFIARMDADDVSLPQRLARQVAFMRTHPDVGVCGCWLRSLGEQHPYRFRYEAQHDAIVCNLLFGSPMPHPAVLFRAEAVADLDGPYHDDYPHTEDYALWIRLSGTTRFANISKVLFLYRQHPTQVTRVFPHHQRDLRGMLLRRLGIDPTPEEEMLHEAVALWTFGDDPAVLDGIHTWLMRLLDANATAAVYQQSAFLMVLAGRWKTILHYFTRHGHSLLRPYHDSVLTRNARGSAACDLALAVKFLIRYSR